MLDEYSTCARTFATIRIYPERLDPEEITARLGKRKGGREKGTSWICVYSKATRRFSEAGNRKVGPASISTAALLTKLGKINRCKSLFFGNAILPSLKKAAK